MSLYLGTDKVSPVYINEDEPDVIFYDYDGTVITQYSSAHFAALTELPPNPTHDGLTAKGWNWTLSDAKAYVAEYGKLNIGQMYVPTDGKTKIYITIPDNAQGDQLIFYVRYKQSVSKGVTTNLSFVFLD